MTPLCMILPPLDGLWTPWGTGSKREQYVCSSILCSSESQFTPGTAHSHSLPWLLCPSGALIDSSPHHKVQIWLLCVCFCFQRLSSSHSLLAAFILWCARSEPIKMFLSSLRRPCVLHLGGLHEGSAWALCSLCPRPSSASTQSARVWAALQAFSVWWFPFYKPGEHKPEIPPPGRCCCQPVISFSIYCVSSFDNPCHMWLHFPPFP